MTKHKYDYWLHISMTWLHIPMTIQNQYYFSLYIGMTIDCTSEWLLFTDQYDHYIHIAMNIDYTSVWLLTTHQYDN